MHVYHQPLPVIDEMEVEELVALGKEAAALLKILIGARRCPFIGG